jgi:hypothetical protein
MRAEDEKRSLLNENVTSKVYETYAMPKVKGARDTAFRFMYRCDKHALIKRATKSQKEHGGVNVNIFSYRGDHCGIIGRMRRERRRRADVKERDKKQQSNRSNPSLLPANTLYL